MRPNDAKSRDNVSKRIRIQNNEETKQLLLDDTYHNLEIALEKDGTTGHLSLSDGMLRGKPQVYKGFFLQCFGIVKYEGNLDVFGKLMWFGFAKKEIKIQGKIQHVNFDVADFRPLGFTTEHEAGNYLIELINQFHEQN